MNNEIMSVLYLFLVLILIFPGFIYANKNKKTFLKNIVIWSGIILVILIFVNLLSN